MILPVFFSGLATQGPGPIIIGFLYLRRHSERLRGGLQSQEYQREEDEWSYHVQ